MSQSKRESFPLNIKMENESEFQRLSIFDGKNQLVHEKMGKIEPIELPKGLYRIEVELTGQTESNIVRHVDESDHEIKLPERYSSIPFIGYSSSTSYYTDFAYECSRKVTCRPKRFPEVNSSNSLFVMLRFPNSESYKRIRTEIDFKGFTLVTSNKKHIATLNQDNCKINRTYGILAFCVKLPVGQYYLRYEGNQLREIPIYIHDSWQTQLFITIGKEPLFSSMKVLMSRNMGFDTENRYSKAVDSAFLKLQNADYQISDSLRERFAYDKWENPIMGIIGIYLHLLGDGPNDDQLYTKILNNLTGRIGLDERSPDIKILRLMSNLYHGIVSKDIVFEHPPMFMAGYQEIIKHSSTDKYLVKRNSTIDAYSAKLYWDSPITSYAFEKDMIVDIEIVMDNDRDRLEQLNLSTVLALLKEQNKQEKSRIISVEKSKKAKVNTSIDWVVPSVLKSVFAREDNSQPISIQHIASDLELPQVTVKRNLLDLMKGMSQSSDVASNIFNLLNSMTSDQLTDKESVLEFLNRLGNDDIKEIEKSGILRADRKRKIWK